jgi:hypothetical protein
MSQFSRIVCLAALALAAALAATAQVEVLYVTGSQTTEVPLTTYNVNPQTAAATEVSSITVQAGSVVPLTLGSQHFIYVWNGTDVWVYPTGSNGSPQSSPSHHLTFGLPHPVTSFAVDPKGNFAYAAMTWTDGKLNSFAAAVLFTISSIGDLTNTGRYVATYGPNPYISLSSFLFGASGKRLYARSFNNSPYTCIVGYDYYTVSSAGALSSLTDLAPSQANCNPDGASAITDQIAAVASSCCGKGTGSVSVTQISSGKTIGCFTQRYTFCGDDVYVMAIDPSNENLFFEDGDQQLTYIAHFDFGNRELIETGSTIPGNPPVYFSPDSQLVYAVNATDVGIYALQSSQGTLGASSSISEQGPVNIATTTLR